MKHVFGSIEAISDTIYLATTSILGFMLLLSAGDDYVRMLAGIMALVLAVVMHFIWCRVLQLS